MHRGFRDCRALLHLELGGGGGGGIPSWAPGGGAGEVAGRRSTLRVAEVWALFHKLQPFRGLFGFWV